MEDLVWSNEPPTEPGLYGTFRPNPNAPYVVEPSIVRVWEFKGEIRFPGHLRLDGRVWCGPVVLPPPPKFITIPEPSEDADA